MHKAGDLSCRGSPAPSEKVGRWSMNRIPVPKPNSVEAKLKKIISDQLMVDEEQLTPGAEFTQDLGADSLDFVELVMSIEESFDIDLREDEETIEELKTVGKLVEFIDKKIAGSNVPVNVAPSS
jgi:acyl carrier protein